MVTRSGSLFRASSGPDSARLRRPALRRGPSPVPCACADWPSAPRRGGLRGPDWPWPDPGPAGGGPYCREACLSCDPSDREVLPAKRHNEHGGLRVNRPCKGGVPVALSARPAQGHAVPAMLRCCCSSVVEHSLGKGEVESSILSNSTIILRPGTQAGMSGAMSFWRLIESPQNPLAKRWEQALEARGLKKHGEFLLSGRKTVPEALTRHPGRFHAILDRKSTRLN